MVYNILEEMEYNAYSSSKWGDVMSTFGGGNITYDEIGNPFSYYNGTRYTFSWTGTDLTGAVYNSNSYSFTYNDEGVRTTKTKNGVTTTYYLNGTQIVAEETNGNITVYLYDAEGLPLGMRYHGTTYAETRWDTYWYEKNIFGDIVAAYDNTGTVLVRYKYDAYGKPTITYYNGGADKAVTKNPFMFRGYYYDSDLQLYYLNARYYDANTGRFISPDRIDVVCATPGALTDKNLYAYCDNNPVMRVDYDGEYWDYIIGGAIGAVIGGVLGGITAGESGQNVFVGALTGAVLGASAGLIVASGNIAMISSAVSSVASKAATDVIGATMYGNDIGSWEDYMVAFVFGGITQAASSGFAKNLLDIVTRPAVNQLVKMGTRGKEFNAEKYVYDVALRAATSGKSQRNISGNFGKFTIKVDIQKCFKRATTRGIYSYMQ